jgi:hypothetical protein
MTTLGATVAGVNPPRDFGRIDSRYIVRAVTGGGSHFFDRPTMRFFDSRVAHTGWQIIDPAGWDHQYVVVTSERFDSHSPRLYTVRLFTMTDHGRRVHHADDVRGFQGYGSARAAGRAAEEWARELAAGVA